MPALGAAEARGADGPCLAVLVWEGTPDTGTLVADYSSDDLILPHARVGPGKPADVCCGPQRRDLAVADSKRLVH